MSNYIFNRRKYKRINSLACIVKAGIDYNKLTKVNMLNISAGGISFSGEIAGNAVVDVDDKIYLEIIIHMENSEICFVLESQIVRMSEGIYASKFVNIEPHVQEELERIIKISIESGIKEMVLFEPSKTFFKVD